MSQAEIESARREWQEGYDRLVDGADRDERDRLLSQVDVVLEELRRRIGATFTLAELADAYAGVEQWSRVAVAEHAPGPGWPRTLSLVEAAAFHLYARGAVDYAP
jgi:hypothetical protein